MRADIVHLKYSLLQAILKCTGLKESVSLFEVLRVLFAGLWQAGKLFKANSSHDGKLAR